MWLAYKGKPTDAQADQWIEETSALIRAALGDGVMSRNRGRERQAAHAPFDLGDHSPRAVLGPDFLGGVSQEFSAEIGQRKTKIARAHVNSHYVAEARVERRPLAPIRVVHDASPVERADLFLKGGWLERQPMREGRQGDFT